MIPLMSSAAWAYFRLDLRHRWRPPQIRAALLVLAVIVVLQVLITWVINHPAIGFGSTWMVLNCSAAVLQLTNDLLWVFEDVLVVGPAQWQFLYRVEIVVASLTAPAFWLLLPAFLATSIAGEREQLRLDEVTVTRLTSGEILLAKGLAAALPFLLLLAGRVLLDLLILFLLRFPALSEEWSAPPILNELAPEFPSPVHAAMTMLFTTVAWPVGLLLTCAVMVCLSALCKRLRTALLAVYGLVFLQGVFAIAWANWLSKLLVQEGWLHQSAGSALHLLVLIAALWFLIPRARAAVEAQP
ncbi:MAG: hypothetical protein ACK47B_02130 [Armatimonadota bacterium]